MTTCPCQLTGYINGRPCTCPCRPFSDEGAAIARPPAPTPRPIDPVTLTDLQVAIDQTVAWADRYLSHIIRLGTWATYLGAGGSQTIVAERVLLAAYDLQLAGRTLPTLLANLTQAALDVEGGDELIGQLQAVA